MSTIPSDFQPDSGASNYLKLTQGKHRIRILSEAIAGYSWWEDTPEGGRKPGRIPMDGRPPVEFAESVKKFLAFTVYNYEAKKIQVWEVNQVSIQKELKALEADPDWENLMDFDLEIERTGTDKNTTRYRVTPKPKGDLAVEVAEAVTANGLPVLEGLYEEGADPFTYVIGGQKIENVDPDEVKEKK